MSDVEMMLTLLSRPEFRNTIHAKSAPDDLTPLCQYYRVFLSNVVKGEGNDGQELDLATVGRHSHFVKIAF